MRSTKVREPPHGRKAGPRAARARSAGRQGRHGEPADRASPAPPLRGPQRGWMPSFSIFV